MNNMAEDQIDGHPLDFGLSLEELRDLMELRKGEAYETIQTKYNGVLEMCKKLYTSSNEGITYLNLTNLIYTHLFLLICYTISWLIIYML